MSMFVRDHIIPKSVRQRVFLALTEESDFILPRISWSLSTCQSALHHCKIPSLTSYGAVKRNWTRRTALTIGSNGLAMVITALRRQPGDGDQNQPKHIPHCDQFACPQTRWKNPWPYLETKKNREKQRGLAVSLLPSRSKKISIKQQKNRTNFKKEGQVAKLLCSDMEEEIDDKESDLVIF